MKWHLDRILLLPALMAALGWLLAGEPGSARAASADLSLTASSAYPNWLKRSNDWIYSFTVSNAGPSTATGVIISNQIPTNVICGGLAYNVNFISATGGTTPTNNFLLVNLGPLAVGATNLIQIIESITPAGNSPATANGYMTNVFQVAADQADPDPANNSATFLTPIVLTTVTSSTSTLDTNLSATLNQQATNYSTELIARLPNGTVVYDQTFNAAYSNVTVQAALAQAAAALSNAGATAYTGPAETNFLQSLVGSLSVIVTNAIGTNYSSVTSLYVGPRTIMVGTNQSQLFLIPAGAVDYDTFVTSVVTNLVTTTNTDTYLDSAQYVMNGTISQSDLSLIGSVTDVTYGNQTGSNLIYSITVSNAGPSTATGVVISNQVPTNAVFVAATGGAMPTNGLLLVNLGSLAVGATNSVQIFVQKPAETNHASVTFSNVFQVFANQTDPDQANNSISIVCFVDEVVYTTSTRTYDTNYTATVNQQAANYSTELIAKLPNGTVVYDHTFNAAYSNATVQAAVAQAAAVLTNAGAMAYTGPAETNASQSLISSNSVTATNLIGTGVSSASATYIGPQTIMVGDNQSELVYLFPGYVDIDTLYTSVVTNLVTTTNTDTYLDSAQYVMNGTIGQSDLSLIARATPQPVGVGSNLVYTLEMVNLGPAPATGIILSNQIPATTAFVSASGGVMPPGHSPQPTNGVLLINIGALPTNTATFASITVQPLVAGQLSNRFTVFADQMDPNPTNNAATVVSTVTNAPPPQVDVALSLIAAPNPVNVGSPLTYSLTVTNNSSTTATGVVVSNTLPPDVTFVSALPSQGTATNHAGVVQFTVGSLPNGEAATLAIVVIPNAAGLLTNQATAYSAQPDSVPANNRVTNVTAAVSVPITNLVLTVLSSATLDPQTGLFAGQVMVSNGGPATPPSVLVLVSGLAANAKLYNATGQTNGLPYVQSAGPLAVGSNVVFLLEFYVPTRVAPENLTLTVAAGPPVNPPVITGTVLSVSRTVGLPDGDVLVEFATIPGRIYAVQYSSNLVAWQTAVPVITAPANRLQWIDAGPPQTASRPTSQSARYYRVILLPAN